MERLRASKTEPSSLLLIPSLRHLQTLHFDVRLTGEKDIVLGFYAALISSPLPLRHLRLHHEVTVLPDDPKHRSYPQLFAVLPTFIAAHAALLQTLDLHLEVGDEDLDWSELLPVPAKMATEMTAALLSCRSLRRAELRDWYLSPAAPATRGPAFPHLQALRLDIVLWTDGSERSLALLLDSSPHLQELDLHASSLPHYIFPFIAGRCHELRTLILSTDDNDDDDNDEEEDNDELSVLKFS